MKGDPWILFILNLGMISILDTSRQTDEVQTKYMHSEGDWKITADLKMLWPMVQSPAWNQTSGMACEQYISIWVMGQNTPSAGLQVMQNCSVEWLLYQMTALSFWGTLKDWRKGTAGISLSSSLGSTKPCTWGGIISWTGAHCGAPDWKPALWEKAWGSWWWRPSQQCILRAKKANCSWGVEEE